MYIITVKKKKNENEQKTKNPILFIDTTLKKKEYKIYKVKKL